MRGEHRFFNRSSCRSFVQQFSRVRTGSSSGRVDVRLQVFCRVLRRLLQIFDGLCELVAGHRPQVRVLRIAR